MLRTQMLKLTCRQVILLSIFSCVHAQSVPLVHDLSTRDFSAEEVKRLLVVPKANAATVQSDSDQTSSPTKKRKTRGLSVEAAESPATALTYTPPKLSMQLPFAFDSAEILDSAKSRLDALGTALQSPELIDERYVVSGHTDASGPNEYNLDLSKRRAESVKDYLVAKHRVAPSRIVSVGRGSSELIDPIDPRAASNRRVAIEGIR